MLTTMTSTTTCWHCSACVWWSTYNEFPFYVMGYAPSISDGVMVDAPTTKKLWRGNESDFPGEDACPETVTVNGTTFYVEEKGENQGRQYFIADGIPTKIDGKYKVIAKVKASEAASFNVNMGWGWGSGEQKGSTITIPEGTEFQEVEWAYEGIGGASCNLVAQPWGFAGTIEWQSLEVYEWQKEGQRPKVWLEDIENGDAEKPWGDLATVKFNDQENNFKICAWGKERGENLNDDGGWDPFPATIEEEEGGNGNHVFVVHGKAATTEGDASAWDNQFWIQSKHEWKSGTTLKIKFRYKASKEVKVATQCHKQNPSDYLIWHAIGDINFTEDWQTFEKDVTIADDMAGTWSVAFQLNQNDKDAIDFYFDDLSWQYLKLDEGYFASGINTNVTKDYDDLDNAIEFEEEKDAAGKATGNLIAVVGTKGDAKTYVDQLMISTTRGDDAAFKGATLKPVGKIHNDVDEWLDYAASTNAKLDLPGLGVWKIYLDLEYDAMAFEMLEGTMYEEVDPIDVVTNKTEIIVKGQERAEIKTGDDDTDPTHTGAAWDNQFWFVANRTLAKGEVTHLKFKYKANKGTDEAPVKTSTQCHGNPGGYMHWAAIGEVNFTTDWQEFDKDFTVPAEADGMQSIAFNMAEIKEACDYEITEVQWYLKDETLDAGKTYENLIDAEGTKNFYVKEGAGTDPHEFGTESGINEVVNKTKASNAVIYNLAGQRVSKDYKGIVVKDNKKVVLK